MIPPLCLHHEGGMCSIRPAFNKIYGGGAGHFLLSKSSSTYPHSYRERAFHIGRPFLILSHQKILFNHSRIKAKSATSKLSRASAIAAGRQNPVTDIFWCCRLRRTRAFSPTKIITSRFSISMARVARESVPVEKITPTTDFKRKDRAGRICAVAESSDA